MIQHEPQPGTLTSDAFLSSIMMRHMRTTINIDKPILEDIRRIQAKERKSLGEIVSELLADALALRRAKRQQPPRFEWTSQSMRPLVDLEDKEAVYSVLDEDSR